MTGYLLDSTRIYNGPRRGWELSYRMNTALSSSPRKLRYTECLRPCSVVFVSVTWHNKSKRFHENIIFITRTIQDHPTRKLYHENIFFCCQIIFIWFVWFRLCMGSVLRFLISNAVLIGSWKERIFVSLLWYYRLHNKNNQLLSYKSGKYWPLSIYV